MRITEEYSADRGQRQASESFKINHCVRQIIEYLMKGIRKRDAASKTPFHWMLDILPVGSVVDGTKILMPDEFDFLIVFKRFLPNDRVPVGQEYVSQVEQFRLYLVQSMQELDAQLLMYQKRSCPVPISFEFVDSELRRVCLNIRLTWRGLKNSRFRSMPISVDLTPVFHFVGWKNYPGLRTLRSLSSMPHWIYKDQDVEHFRPVKFIPSSSQILSKILTMII